MCGLEFDGEDRVVCTTAQGRKKMFEFERVYDPETTQEKASNTFLAFINLRGLFPKNFIKGFVGSQPFTVFSVNNKYISRSQNITPRLCINVL